MYRISPCSKLTEWHHKPHLELLDLVNLRPTWIIFCGRAFPKRGLWAVAARSTRRKHFSTFFGLRCSFGFLDLAASPQGRCFFRNYFILKSKSNGYSRKSFSKLSAPHVWLDVPPGEGIVANLNSISSNSQMGQKHQFWPVVYFCVMQPGSIPNSFWLEFLYVILLIEETEET